MFFIFSPGMLESLVVLATGTYPAGAAHQAAAQHAAAQAQFQEALRERTAASADALTIDGECIDVTDQRRLSVPLTLTPRSPVRGGKEAE